MAELLESVVGERGPDRAAYQPLLHSFSLLSGGHEPLFSYPQSFQRLADAPHPTGRWTDGELQFSCLVFLRHGRIRGLSAGAVVDAGAWEGCGVAGAMWSVSGGDSFHLRPFSFRPPAGAYAGDLPRMDTVLRAFPASSLQGWRSQGGRGSLGMVGALCVAGIHLPVVGRPLRLVLCALPGDLLPALCYLSRPRGQRGMVEGSASGRCHPGGLRCASFSGSGAHGGSGCGSGLSHPTIRGGGTALRRPGGLHHSQRLASAVGRSRRSLESGADQQPLGAHRLRGLSSAGFGGLRGASATSRMSVVGAEPGRLRGSVPGADPAHRGEYDLHPYGVADPLAICGASQSGTIHASLALGESLRCYGDVEPGDAGWDGASRPLGRGEVLARGTGAASRLGCSNGRSSGHRMGVFRVPSGSLSYVGGGDTSCLLSAGRG